MEASAEKQNKGGQMLSSKFLLLVSDNFLI